MTKGKTNSVSIALLLVFLFPVLNAHAASLGTLIAQQDTALRALEQVMAGRNPYLQWRSAQEAVGTVRQTSGTLAQESTKIERKLGELAGENRQLVIDKETLLKELQGLRIFNRNLATANENLAGDKQQLLSKYERFETRQSFFAMAFYGALALAFLGFGGLLIRIPNTRLERRLTRLEIASLENQLRKEAIKSQADEVRARQAKRPMSERKAIGFKPPKVDPRSTGAKAAKVGPGTIQEATRPKTQTVAASRRVAEKNSRSSEQKAKQNKTPNKTKRNKLKQKKRRGNGKKQ